MSDNVVKFKGNGTGLLMLLDQNTPYPQLEAAIKARLAENAKSFPAGTVIKTSPNGFGQKAQAAMMAIFDEYSLKLEFSDESLVRNATAARSEHSDQRDMPAGRDERVEEMLRLINLTGYEKSAISRLSGGEQQRVAIARALVNHPRVLLLDEPLSALDLKLRKEMQRELKAIQQRVGITFVFVTHDQEEALTMSDTVVVMNKGSIQQIGTPTDIYNEPKNAFVADFIGESNILDGVLLADRKVRFSGHTFDCVDGGFGEKEPVDVVVRPEDVDIVAPEKGMLRGNVSTVTFMGVHYEIIVDINGFKWMIQTTDFVAEGSHIGLYIEPDAIHIMKKSEYSGLYGDYSLDIDPEAVPAESERAE